MLTGHIRVFANILIQIVKLRLLELTLLVRGGRSVTAAGLTGERAVRVRQLQLPLTTHHGLQLIILVIEEIGVVRIFNVGSTGQQRPDVEAINLVLREGRSHQLRDRHHRHHRVHTG